MNTFPFDKKNVDKKNKVNLTIDGLHIQVVEQTTILNAAKSVGIEIPSLCYHPNIEIFGSCRVCIVEVDGSLVTSCTTPVEEGMEVLTRSPYVERVRRDLIDLIISDHPFDCMVCQKTGDCELQELAYRYNIRFPIFRGERRRYNRNDNNPFIARDMEKCILCGRCAHICEEVQGVGAIDFAHKGFYTTICPPFEKDLDCEFCGQCIMVCPTGALVAKKWIGKGRYWKIKQIDTICPYCGVGCGITLHVKDNTIVRITGKDDSPVNKGLLCVKGRFAYDFVSSPDRLKKPLIKNGSDFREVSWDEAFSFTASKLKQIKGQYGSDSIGGLASARCTTEDNYLFQKFMRVVIGTNNVDHCARL